MRIEPHVIPGLLLSVVSLLGLLAWRLYAPLMAKRFIAQARRVVEQNPSLNWEWYATQLVARIREGNYQKFMIVLPEENADTIMDHISQKISAELGREVDLWHEVKVSEGRLISYVRVTYKDERNK